MKIVDIIDKLPKHKTRKPKLRQISQIKYVVLHCTDAPPSVGPFEVAKYDVTPGPQNHLTKLGAPTISYHYFVMPDGTAYKCLPANIISFHAGKWNEVSIAIAMAYRATGNPNPPPKAQLNATAAVAHSLCQVYNIPVVNVKGHRELSGTGYYIKKSKKVLRKTCPGLKVDMDEFRSQVESLLA